MRPPSPGWAAGLGLLLALFVAFALTGGVPW